MARTVGWLVGDDNNSNLAWPSIHPTDDAIRSHPKVWRSTVRTVGWLETTTTWPLGHPSPPMMPRPSQDLAVDDDNLAWPSIATDGIIGPSQGFGGPRYGRMVGWRRQQLGLAIHPSITTDDAMSISRFGDPRCGRMVGWRLRQLGLVSIPRHPLLPRFGGRRCGRLVEDDNLACPSISLMVSSKTSVPTKIWWSTVWTVGWSETTTTTWLGHSSY
ncbi:hypothetical protein ml_521 [Mollivirus sibericum]|uniref:hypothetical protein n=1 Tax=Mollivirus sibericum TaxID=1678078 RepID=UPI0006B2EB43|nr:hypothetical protein ml_3 [Mollivirus sibericum]YP_009165487.1 hypothetical protein ml_521 [Mollivirus sibericum]ALD61805.1 hypothetical protein ml_3 [Mollivirus sibericum]ALD62323.1 hypothetical protein ml_521 [Mollivirus sibericum]